MPTLRLDDPDGYTVPDGTRDHVTAQTEAQTRQELLTLADQHAADWADFGYEGRLYRVVTGPTT